MNEALNGVLSEFRPALQADGFDLQLDAIQPAGRVVVRVLHGPSACEDCLMPDERLVAMLKQAMQRVVPDVSEVVLKHDHPL